MAVLTIALGVGASTSIFTVVDGVLLRPLPYPEPERIVRIFELSDTGRAMNVPEANFADWKAGSHTVAKMAMHSGGYVTTFGTGAESVRGREALVSEGFFDVLGVQAELGRTFLTGDHGRGAAPVAVVSHGFWERVLGGGRDVARLVVRVGGSTIPVVGVMPPGFSYPAGVEVWVTAEPGAAFNPSRSAHNWRVLGRLAPGVSARAATAEIAGISRRIHETHSDVTAVGARVEPLRDALTAPVRTALLVLLGAVGVLLLIACANVTNLLLAQAVVREREMALRSALGASRWQLLRQSLTESTLLAAVGGALGVLCSSWAVDAMLSLASRRLPRAAEIGLDGRVVAFAVGVSLLTGIIVGLIPALRTARTDVQDVLRDGGRAHGGGPRHRSARSALVVAQVAMTMALLVGSGLLARSFVRTLQVDLGFQAGRQLTVDVLAPYPSSPDRNLRLAQLHRDLEAYIAGLPGVLAVGGINSVPLSGSNANGRFLIEGGTDSGQYWPSYLVASPGYFAAMGIPLLAGRLLSPADTAETPHVAVISRQVAERVWPGQDPLGKRINTGNMDGDHRDWITIVGIVGDVRQQGPEASAHGAVYVHAQQRPQRTGEYTAVVRAAVDPAGLIPAVRRKVQELDPELAVVFGNVAQLAASVLSDRRFNLTLIAVFGASALLLALLGIYGVVSYSVAQRTREIGIRVAVGATEGRIVRQFLVEGGRLVVLGIVLGLAAAAALGRALASLLYDTSPHDPLTYAAAAAALALVALTACYLPSRRAARVDPMVALRQD